MSQIAISPIRHKALPVHLVIASRLICEVFYDILGQEYEQMLENFARDVDYNREFIVWSAMANTYIQYIRETDCPYNDEERKQEAFSYLLKYSLDGDFKPENVNFERVSKNEYVLLIANYVDNYKHIESMINSYSGPSG